SRRRHTRFSRDWNSDVCSSDLKIPIRRIYNRVIFDDLQQNADLTPEFQLTDDVDVTWVGHPNWFFRISKYMLPLLSGPFFPPTKYLSDYRGSFPTDLKNYVLKPLFSFADRKSTRLNSSPVKI